MKFVAIADTHGQHDQLVLPPADVLIHAGDVSMRGTEEEIFRFLRWFSTQPFTYKIMVAGNHDFFFERAAAGIIANMIPADVCYLNDSHVLINGIKIWGSPITPWFYKWAFNRHRGEAIKKHWDLIDADADIVVTHGPVHKVLDKTTGGTHAGCEDLLHKVNEVKPAVHICGHIHEGYGKTNINGTTFINASVLNERYLMVNKPVVFEL